MTDDFSGRMALTELADWYWETLNPDMAEDLDPDDHEVVVRKAFMHGACGPFAAVLHEMTGWQLVNLSSPSLGEVHSLVRAPDGRLLDAAGWMTESSIAKRYGLRKPTFTDVTIERLMGLDSMDYEEHGDDGEPTGFFRGQSMVVSSVRALSGAPFDEPWFREMSCREMLGVDTPLRRETVIPKP